MSLDRWANLRVLRVSLAELYSDNKISVCIHELYHKNLQGENNSVKQSFHHMEGLTFAIIIVLELPPRESCDDDRHEYVSFEETGKSTKYDKVIQLFLTWRRNVSLESL